MNFENWNPIIYESKTNTHTQKKIKKIIIIKFSPPPPPKPLSSSSTLIRPRPKSTASRVWSSTLLTRWRTFGDASMFVVVTHHEPMHAFKPKMKCLRHDSWDLNHEPMALPIRVRELWGVAGDRHWRKTQILLFLCLLLLHLISPVIFRLILLDRLV